MAELEEGQGVVETMTPEPAPVAEGTGSEESTPAAVEGGEALKPNYYSDEEATQILESGGVLDSNRLTPTQKLVQKSFEKGTTRAFQEAAEMKRQYETAMRSFQEQQAIAADPKEKLFRDYVQNPINFVREINQAIENLEMIDPMADNYRESRQQIAKLRGLKDEFDVRRTQMQTEHQSFDNIQTQTMAEIVEAIPNFHQVKDELSNFAYTQLGLSQQDVNFFTNPVELARRGLDPKAAVRVTKAVNKVFQIMNAGRMAEQKVVKTPPQTVAAGTPGTPQSNTVSYKKAFEHALKTGDWTQVYKHKGIPL